MVFSNLLFIFIFLPINLMFYYLMKNIKGKNIVLVVFSLLFYAWGEPLWIFLLLFSTLINYLHAIAIERCKDKKIRKYILLSDIIISLLMLGIFKYSGFVIENINNIFNVSMNIPKFSLPIGISFYTFQTLSYTVDVYRKDVKAQRSFLNFLMYVSLYPQLVAGPIVRYVDIEKEIENRKFDINQISQGINRFIIGLAKKVLIANVAGEFVVSYMGGQIQNLSVLEAWFGIAMFTIQIYFDFSGYSDMAIGLGKMFGFNYSENFNYPYISKSATEFWRRWHISLGSFFRDYVYIPLGGNRKRQLLNIFIVWFLTGLWHGASWNFIIWGLYFGFIIYFEKKVLLKVIKNIPSFILIIYSLFIVMIGWVLFYFTNLKEGLAYIGILFGIGANGFYTSKLGLVLSNNITWIIIALVSCTPVLKLISEKVKNMRAFEGKEYLCLGKTFVNAIILIAVIALLVGESYNPFLYFRF